MEGGGYIRMRYTVLGKPGVSVYGLFSGQCALVTELILAQWVFSEVSCPSIKACGPHLRRFEITASFS